MTQLSTTEHEAMMEDMRQFDEQMPCVGIFWYDPADKALFGVRKSELTPKMVEDAANDGVPYINYPHLHRQVWAKEFLPVGFIVKHKEEALLQLSQEQENSISQDMTHLFYWEKPIKKRKKPIHPGENDVSLPVIIRGKHYESWTDLARDLGYHE